MFKLKWFGMSQKYAKANSKNIGSRIHNDWLGLKGVLKSWKGFKKEKPFAINQLYSRWIRNEPWSITEHDAEVVFKQSIIPYFRLATVSYEILFEMSMLRRATESGLGG